MNPSLQRAAVAQRRYELAADERAAAVKAALDENTYRQIRDACGVSLSTLCVLVKREPGTRAGPNPARASGVPTPEEREI